MITHSGVHIQKIGGADGTPTAMDIAVHAGRICRFGGAVWYPLLPHLIFSVSWPISGPDRSQTCFGDSCMTHTRSLRQTSRDRLSATA